MQRKIFCNCMWKLRIVIQISLKNKKLKRVIVIFWNHFLNSNQSAKRKILIHNFIEGLWLGVNYHFFDKFRKQSVKFWMWEDGLKYFRDGWKDIERFRVWKTNFYFKENKIFFKNIFQSSIFWAPNMVVCFYEPRK